MDQIINLIATGFYVGLLPFAPGVYGAMAATGIWYLCKKIHLLIYLIVMLGIFTIGVYTSDVAERMFGKLDASPIVIDEILGIFISLTKAPDRKTAWVSGFIIFMLLDGLKPFPASWLDANLHGGLGIMLDDAVAGLYTFVLLQLFYFLNSKRKMVISSSSTQ